ncbi:EscJ/YscJ/HrcJ family type III secretion inner membrane ring protein [Pseudomonas sp. ANT_J12]|uniref:type III secretion system inner membrane ring lipoprotein SctJ n=1 Tax=Pseudomonas sp. ANT_J12 TaxID=2597351 RepID=UPI0011F0CAFE|nr:type III secretion inner membrane ring lipoprotein SctJ [Pseudomonas sp. ANT_J12]KAA0994905.1 EscJ/YscJ/HrcJ family type III secretion inner membrane ring protein [Pseudomonas sp. ANT_J12]
MKFFAPIVLLCLLLLSGCSDDTELFGGLSEPDSNDVIAKLADQHIDARKQMQKTGVTIIVAARDINRAVRVLEAAGLPRRSRTSLGEIFKKEGVISTPLEERARYIYALSQELESTLSQIDGVIVARVHVVLPERIAPGEPVQPASAAVFIKHTAALDPDSVRGRIQQMVASSIPGMSQEAANSKKFAIVFVPSVEFQDKENLVRFGPFLIDSPDVGFWHVMAMVIPISLLLLLAALTLALRRDWRVALFARVWPGRRSDSTLPANL